MVTPQWKAMILVAMGVLLVVDAVNMRATINVWEETVTTATEVPGTKGERAVIGGGVGAAGGGLLAALVGGIGIVIAGTGFGLPAGAALIATSAAMGGVAGAVAGAATGDSATSDVVTSTEVYWEPAYSAWHWAPVLVVGLVLLLMAGSEIGNITRSAKPAPVKPEI